MHILFLCHNIFFHFRTDLIANGPGSKSFFAILSGIFVRPFFSMATEEGAYSQLFAATAEDAKPGEFYGPQGFYEMSGPPGPVPYPCGSKDPEVAKKLWDISVSLTNVTWPSA
jgi:hypothetical protein